MLQPVFPQVIAVLKMLDLQIQDDVVTFKCVVQLRARSESLFNSMYFLIKCYNQFFLRSVQSWRCRICKYKMMWSRLSALYN